MKSPSIAPFFACLYPGLCSVARELGYALAIHGSLETDLDLIAIPWTDEVVEAETLKEAISQHIEACDFEGVVRRTLSDEAGIQKLLQSVDCPDGPTHKPHGRIAWNLWLQFGRKIDLSVMPLEESSTIERVEQILGHKVDRRKRYKVIDGKPCELATFTDSCSGCYETIDGQPMAGAQYDKNGIALGGGCEECGYQGKRRTSMWVPILNVEI